MTHKTSIKLSTNPLRTMQFFPHVLWEFADCSVFCKNVLDIKFFISFHFKSTLFCIIYLCLIYSEAFSQAKSRFFRAFFTILDRSDYVTCFSSFSFCIANPAHLGIVFSFLYLSLVQWLWRKVSSCKSYKVIIFPATPVNCGEFSTRPRTMSWTNCRKAYFPPFSL